MTDNILEKLSAAPPNENLPKSAINSPFNLPPGLYQSSESFNYIPPQEVEEKQGLQPIHMIKLLDGIDTLSTRLTALECKIDDYMFRIIGIYILYYLFS